MTRIAIVTGASAGLGVEFARQIDARREVDQVWLVARRKERLEQTAAQLKHAEGVIVALDLSVAGAHKKLSSRLEKAGSVDIVWLVNNAGYGLAGKFRKADLDRQLNMIDLNCRALTALTGIALRYLKQGSHIVNVGSAAGFMAMPGFAVYAATKAYVNAFSQALAAELKNDGISVTAVCPGPVATEFQEVAGLTGAAAKSRFMAQPEDVVRDALKAAAKGEPMSIHGAVMKAYSVLSQVVPRNLVARRGNLFAERMK
ncbi:MAG: SDR family NAD(P)-dependent oxidoreductase [Candidatus Dadabacteria bacterium]|nr:MAG: SDR family NAD(P)-dependent oxidoreductase [Candidatus Dadabacteria bacterium]